MPNLSNLAPAKTPATKTAADDDEDDDKAWANMTAKRDKKKSIWKSKKTLGMDLGAIIN